MKTFWFFWLRFRRAYDSAYDSDFLFSLGHKSCYDTAYESNYYFVASETSDDAYDLKKIKKIGVISGVIWVISAMEWESDESERFHFFRLRLRLRRLCCSKNQIVGVESRTGGINKSQCTFPRFFINLVLPLLLLTPTIWFSLYHKRNLSYGVVSGIEMRFHKTISSTLLIMTPTPTSAWPFEIRCWQAKTTHKLVRETWPWNLFEEEVLPLFFLAAVFGHKLSLSKS